ncbi:MAG: RnfABCDGE type electron transport complex subunit B [Gammaproteobacteria bacterium]|nr:RnfABCDGE type electron transport complex subunit B [Gammaproteobacteria bacterium]
MSRLDNLPDRVLALLPQTQCRQCGYDGCQPFAEALSAGQASPAACPPGGVVVEQRLRALLALAPAASGEKYLAPLPHPVLARIREAECIGCTKCLVACPVDAIVGAALQLHTVLTAHCTGCALCLPPCPVDCIDLVPAQANSDWPHPQSPAAMRIATSVAQACTHCGACPAACPEELNPERLLKDVSHANFDAAAAAGLARCTECARCDAVCPSEIPLSAYFAHGRATLAAITKFEAQARSSATRYAANLARPPFADRLRQATTDGLAELGLTPAALSDEINGAVMRAHARRAANALNPDA